MTGFDVRVETRSAAEHPKVFTDVALHYVVRGRGIQQKAVERAIELSLTKYCPAHAMLAKAAPIRSSFEIVEGDASAPPNAPARR